MTNILTMLPWRRALLVILGAVVTSVLLPIVIPLALSTANEWKQINEARLKRAVQFGDRNTEFNVKLNGLKTSIGLFLDQAFDMNLSAAALKEEQTQFRKAWGDRYLDFDEKAWWWYGDMEREASVLKLCSPDKLTQLQSQIKDYGVSVNASVSALGEIWEYLRSNKLKLQDKAKIQDMRSRAETEVAKQNQIRNNLVRNISVLFAECDK